MKKFVVINFAPNSAVVPMSSNFKTYAEGMGSWMACVEKIGSNLMHSGMSVVIG